MTLTLDDVQPANDEHVQYLYGLLKERPPEANIDHRDLPREVRAPRDQRGLLFHDREQLARVDHQ